MDKVTINDGSPWSMRAVDKLVELWREGLPPETISQMLGRSEAQIRSKAAELRLPQHVTLAP
jgi:hypothetical protein